MIGLNLFRSAPVAATDSMISARRARPQSASTPAAAPPHAPSARPDDQLVSFTRPRSLEAEQYRTLCQIVESRRRAGALNVLAVSSAGIGDGKTMTTLNLAGALAQSPGSRVLLIDGDLRRPAVAAQLRLTGPVRPGLAGAIGDPAISISDAMHGLPEWNLSVLTAGHETSSPYEMLRSEGFAEVISKARASFDFVLIDCPPLLAVPDCRVIAPAVDGFLLVVSADSTPRKLLEEALNILPADKVVGIVFNRDTRPLSGYYGYYGRYGDPASAGRS